MRQTGTLEFEVEVDVESESEQHNKYLVDRWKLCKQTHTQCQTEYSAAALRKNYIVWRKGGIWRLSYRRATLRRPLVLRRTLTLCDAGAHKCPTLTVYVCAATATLN